MENPTATAGNQSEGERLIGIAEKLLETRDLTGSREFAVLAQETEPFLDGSDQILAICDVLIAGDKRIGNNNQQHDWYGILQVDRRSNDFDLIKRNYRRLALLLHPDKNKYPLANSAFRFVADAWSVLSDQSKKSAFDAELSHFSRVELTPRPCNNVSDPNKLPVRRSSRVFSGGNRSDGVGGESESSFRTPAPPPPPPPVSNFWTACPYCYVLYEYPKVYEDCCLRCQSCQRAFHAAVVPAIPPRVPGKEAYYCCWGFFPLGFSADGKKGTTNAASFPTWMPPIFSGEPEATTAKIPTRAPPEDTQVRVENVMNVPAAAGAPQPALAAATVPATTTTGQKKRGRPRKNPF